MNLELRWGRLRRAWLRRFRPGYVRRMAALRQGECAQCSHDIIDPRDLKFVRNVCGYWFRPEDDRFGWRGRLGLARVGLAEVICYSLLFLTVTLLVAALGTFLHGAFWMVLPGVLFLWAEAVLFFRDPERVIPTDPEALLSPADGRVDFVGEVEDPTFPGGRAFRVSIFLSVFNVHVNRVPRTARVVGLRYLPGRFLDARRAECAVENEQLWIDLEEGDRFLRVKQISGAVARRIVCWLKLGESVRAGERLGMIKYGSRTDILLPVTEPVEVLVRPGDKVHGGSTVLLKLKRGC